MAENTFRETRSFTTKRPPALWFEKARWPQGSNLSEMREREALRHEEARPIPLRAPLPAVRISR